MPTYSTSPFKINKRLADHYGKDIHLPEEISYILVSALLSEVDSKWADVDMLTGNFEAYSTPSSRARGRGQNGSTPSKAMIPPKSLEEKKMLPNATEDESFLRPNGEKYYTRKWGEHVDVDVLRERLAAGVDLEDLRPALAVRPIDDDLAVEAARAQQRRVEDVRPVGCCDQDDVVLHLEAVHLDEQLVERLLTFVVATTHTGATMATDGVDLVDEDDAR